MLDMFFELAVVNLSLKENKLLDAEKQLHSIIEQVEKSKTNGILHHAVYYLVQLAILRGEQQKAAQGLSFLQSQGKLSSWIKTQVRQILETNPNLKALISTVQDQLKFG